MTIAEMPKNIEKELIEYSPLVRRLLFNRGILTKKEAEEFLNPSYEDHIHDPFLMLNLEKAVDRIYEAIKNDERICIYSDYDCDGIPGSVIWNDLFEKINYKNFSIYIPDRHKEGYGLNMSAISEIAKDGNKILITLDLGITAVEEVEYAKKLGLETIITDHHLPQEKIPDTLVVNPKQADDKYPDDMLCGSGVVFKIICGFLKKYGEEFGVKAGWEKWLLDMVGLATLADVVPLRKENRALAYFGLRVLRKTRRPGLLKLFSKMRIDPKNLQEEDVTFSICPKLNAASRMDTPKRALELLISKEDLAESSAKHLIQINDERKLLVAHIMKSVKKTFSHEERVDKSVIVVGDPAWRVGVLGIVATKIVEEYKKPAFVWGLEGGETIKGSCRSDGSINMVEIMTQIKTGTFLEFGGHAGAGGFSVGHEEIHFLEERLNEAYEKIEKKEISQSVYEIDSELNLSDVNEKTFLEIERLAPFGEANIKPVFIFKDVNIGAIKIFGKTKEHLELTLEDDEGKSKAISFFKKPEDFLDGLFEGMKINLIATIEKSVFGYKKEIRLRIVDIKK